MDLWEARAAWVAEKPLEYRLAPLTPGEGLASILDAVEGAESGAPCGFTGYASTTERGYPVNDSLGTYTETMSRGAFAKALNDANDVRLLINHQGLPLARTKSGTMSLREDDTGLFVDVPSLDEANPLVQSVRSAMARGDLDQMSFSFKAVRQEWNQDYSQRTVKEVKLFDVSLVTYPANEGTTAKLRSGPSDEDVARRMAQLRARGYIIG